MTTCTQCGGSGSIRTTSSTVGGLVHSPDRVDAKCPTCDGLGAVDDPQMDRLIMAVEHIAVELTNLRHIAERDEHSRGYPK